MAAELTGIVPRPLGHQWREAAAARGGLILLCTALLAFLTVPLAMLFMRSVEARDGTFVGVANFVNYLGTPALARSMQHTLAFAAWTTGLVLPLAFAFAYAIH